METRYLDRIERALAGAMLHVLLLVQIERHAPVHGYALIQRLQEAAGGRDWFKEGTVYPMLNGLEREGMIRSDWGTGQQGPRRKEYQLTGRGRKALALALDEWDRFRGAMDQAIKTMEEHENDRPST